MSPISWFFGYDYFVSYSRRDGRAYALLLKERLTAQKYRCFLDHTEMGPGETLNHSIKNALRHSHAVLLVVTPGAMVSPHVRAELESFKQYTARKIIPIDLTGDFPALISQSAHYSWLTEKLWIDELPSRLNEGPAAEVIASVQQSRNFTRRNLWRKITLTVISTIIGVSLLVAAAFGISMIRAQQKAGFVTQMELLMRTAREVVDTDPHQSAQALDKAMNTVDAAHEKSPAPTEVVARRWMSRRLKVVLEGHTNNLLSIDCSPDGGLVVTGGYDGRLQFWDTANNWKSVGAVLFEDVVCLLRFSPQGDHIAIADEDGRRVALWSLKTREYVWNQTVNLQSKPTGLEWSPDGQSLFVSGKMVLKIAAADGALRDTWDEESKTQIHALVMDPKTGTPAYAVQDSWRVKKDVPSAGVTAPQVAEEILPFWPKHAAWLHLPAKTEDLEQGSPPDPAHLLLTSSDSRVHLWQPGHKPEVLTRCMGVPTIVRTAGAEVIIGTDEGNIDGFDAEYDGDTLFSTLLTGHRITDLCYSRTGQWVAAVSSSERVVRVYEPFQGAAQDVYEKKLETAPNQEWGIDFSADGRRVAVGATLGKIHVGAVKEDNVAELASCFEYRAPKGESLSGKPAWAQEHLAGAYKSGILRIWRGTHKEEKPVEIKLAVEPLARVANRPGRDEFVVTSRSGRVFLVTDLSQTPPHVREITAADRVFFATGSVDGETIIGVDKTRQHLTLWRDVEGGKWTPVPLKTAHSPVAAMQIIRIRSRPATSQVAVAGFNGEIAIFNLTDGSIVAARAGYGTPVFDLDWSPKGDFLAVARYDGTLFSLRGDDLEAVHEVATPFPALTGVRWNAEGDRIYVSGRSDRHSVMSIDFPPLAALRAKMRDYMKDNEHRISTLVLTPPSAN